LLRTEPISIPIIFRRLHKRWNYIKNPHTINSLIRFFHTFSVSHTPLIYNYILIFDLFKPSLPGGGGRFELNEVKLDEERAFLVIESALRAMVIKSFEELKKKVRSKR